MYLYHGMANAIRPYERMILGGFSVLPGGFRTGGGIFGNIGYENYFYSATEYDNNLTWYPPPVQRHWGVCTVTTRVSRSVPPSAASGIDYLSIYFSGNISCK